MIVEHIKSQLKNKRRTLIGIDCNFGFADDFGKQIVGEEYTGHDMWATIDKTNTEITNFFAGGFWTHSEYESYFWTDGTMPDGFQMPRRLTEQACIESGHGVPESPFKLIGAKQVGKGGMAGMRVAHYLKQTHGDDVAIWPFDTMAVCNAASVVITEIYPRTFIRRGGLGNTKLRNLSDVNTILSYLNSKPIQSQIVTDHQTDALVSAAGLRFLCGDEEHVPFAMSIPPPEAAKLCTREGWIFGVEFTP